jgi:2-polyprenyl-3-methyl-5-hydroxy-6-metoxy-1,4-benzoquinol methylase/Tfp pilus assembly protein PilF
MANLEPTRTAAAIAAIDEGNALEEQGRVAEAMARYDAAVELDPRCARAHLNRGNILSATGQIEDARGAYKFAIVCDPQYAGAYFNLGNLNTRIGEFEQALRNYQTAIGIKPEFADAKAAFGASVPRIRFTVNDPQLRAALTSAVKEAWGVPYELFHPALTLIMLNDRIARCVRLANESWPARLPKAALFGTDGLVALAADTLLHASLEAAPVSTIEFERFLTCARHALLETASGDKMPELSDTKALKFYAALARQCFVNEYIFDCDGQENFAAAACRAKLQAMLGEDVPVPPLLLLAVAAYFPLYKLTNASRLLDAIVPSPVDEVLRQQIREPLEERALSAGIMRLTPITGGVSEEVRDLYEQNPYPRWVKLRILGQALRFCDELRRSLPLAQFTVMPDDSAPEALIAGCGTGNHSVFTGRRFRGIHILAVDLSLSSISYAKRKTQELGMTNIEYAQADILKLGDIGRTFDIIESVGVLHHLADPFAGWRTLLRLLRPGGFMYLGFYSEIARRHVVAAREFIGTHDYESTPDGIRRFRQDFIVGNPGVMLQNLCQMPDFYSISGCRDLLFHIQEHRLTLHQIGSFLAENGLEFIGFELDHNVLDRYCARFPDDPSGTNLRNWALFEAENPDTFLGMYQFWVQKPDGAGVSGS